MALIHSLSLNGIKFKISLTSKLGKYSYKNIFFRYSKKLDPFQFGNYSQTLHFFSKQLEDQKCFVYPKSNEVLFWENKGHMTQQFFEKNISTPKTYLVTSETQFESLDLSYPFLIKEEHSASAEGLFKIQNKEDLKNFFKHDYFSKNKFLLAQELLNMRRDLRVILVGDKIVHHYWRINKSSEWKPTSTSHGSGVDFGSFPEQWRSFIIEQFKRLNLTTGAFDIAWRNDDLSTEPLILEVSPNYQPNPIVDLSKMSFSYGEYKDKLLFKDSYDFRYVDIAFSLINQQIVYLKEQNQIG
jgi:glutathione synthase/RimK-type ligase-like ATP-grasp enzyme